MGDMNGQVGNLKVAGIVGKGVWKEWMKMVSAFWIDVWMGGCI